jgi:CheY-like chemotaxis protein
VVVLDVTMPGLNGLELLVAIREVTDTPDLPAVFLSGRIEAEDVAAGHALGAAYLTKPFVASALTNAIDSQLAAQLVTVPDVW